MDEQLPVPPRANGNTNGSRATSHPNYRITNVAAGHRANHVTYGHVGRVAYIPAEDDDRVADHHDMGRLSTNRCAEAEACSFRQVTPCRLWCPPAVPPKQSLQTVSPLADAKPAARSLHWLLREAPNALAGVASASYSPALLRELRASAAAQPPRTRLPLLARGQITSLAGATPSACAALATAVGESGHILRISRLRHDDWAWPRTGSAGRASGPVPLLRGALVDPAEEGYWCAGPTAINQIKFAAQPASTFAPRPVRWVLAQTAQATHVFAPTLHKVPVPAAGASACGGTACSCSRFGLSYISPNPLMRITMDQTGGKPHCDVAFNPARMGATTTAADDGNQQPPQVAIVDQGGNWTVWDLLEIRRPGSKEKITSLQAVLRARGNVADGVSPRTHWAAAASGLGNLHRILWLAPARPSSGMRSSTLLLGNATSVHVVEISAQESGLDTTEEHTRHHLLHTLNMTRQDWLDVVLDVQLLPTHPWHVAVLTTTTLIWLDLSPHTEKKKPGNGHSTPQRSSNISRHDSSRHPVVLLSFPHLRDPTDKTLKLCVTPVCPSGDDVEEHPSPQTSLVFVYSMARPEVSLFWLTMDPTDAGRGASYQHQLFPLTLLPLERSAAGANNAIESLQWTGAQTLSVLPLSFAPQARPEQGSGGDRAAALAQRNVSAPVGTHFFQVLALGSDQRVCSALYANTPRLASQGSLSVAPPHPVVPAEDLKRKWEKVRRQAMRQAYEDSFVVPDDFSENPFSPPSWRRPGGAASRLETVARGTRATAGLPRVGSRSEQDAIGGNATYVVPGVHALLREGLGRAADAARTTGSQDDLQASTSSYVNVDSSPLDIIRQVVERGFVNGSSPYTTLLDAADDTFMAVFVANQTAYSWALKLAELGYIEQGRVFLFDQMQGGSTLGGHKPSASVLEAMARLCALPVWLEESEVARQASSAFRGYRQQHTRLLSYAAVQLFLAQISVVVVPKRLQLQRQAEQAANFPLSGAAAAKRLQPGQVDRFGRLGEPLPAQSSPVAPRHRDMPDWLASSQEFASSQAEGGLGDAEGGGNEDDDDDDELAEEDSTIARLRQYAVSIRSEPPFVRDDPVVAGITGSTTIPASGGVTINNIRLLSHWVLGSDPDHFHWVPVAGGSAGAAEEALRLAALEAQEQKRRRREEKRAQRERERMLLMGAAGLGASIASPRFSALHPPPTPGLPPSSPLAPRILASSQIMPSDSQALPRQIIPGSNYPASSQALPSQVWPSSSQRTAILTGSPFGSGNRPKKKKAKTARGLR